ncbi:MAG: adenine phosphoribosyltransferase, partial [Planctomycetes bacterium]|nr:adenine phosphoribosyltransferase [Planctomycetota bacterium]
MDLQRFIRDVPDLPKKGIIFKDITPILQRPEAFRSVVETLS